MKNWRIPAEAVTLDVSCRISKLAAALLLVAALALFFSVQAEKVGSSGIPSGGETPQIILTTNRMVILDDPGGWDGGNVTINIGDKGNQWSGESTTVRWYVLLLNSSGRGAQGITVTSQLKFPNGTVAATKTSITNSYGIAEFEQDMDRWSIFNGSESEGIYTITAGATLDGTTASGSYNFIYDEWGCGSSGRGCHRSQFWQPNAGVDSQRVDTFAGGSIQNSPYLHAYDNFHSNVNGHGTIITFGAGECLTCHRGFDGAIRDHNSRVRTEPQFPAGIHYGKTACTDCHATFGGTMPIRQCYICHPMRNDNLTVKTFSQTDTAGFSFRPLIDKSVMAHNAGQDIPCILCHRGMHNVSKPFNVTDASNTYTEYQQCTSCHAAYNRHNNGVNCTVCHSQDAHAIKVFARNATYITGVTSPDRGNCTMCHQNSSFLSILLSQPRAGSYPGSAPQIPESVNHSDDAIAGQKWNAYWTPGNSLSACNYCHGDTKHRSSALGRPSMFNGGNSVNLTISAGSTWCQQCHYQGASSYSDMVITFLKDNKTVPPEITGNSTYGNITTSTDGRQAYFNHSGFDSYADAKCKGCHGISVVSDSTRDFVHNVTMAVGEMGGPNCIGCHDYGKTGSPMRINSSAMELGMHSRLNSNALNSTGVPAGNKKCWGCHQSDGSRPPGGRMGDRFNNPYKCYDCHSETKPHAGVSNAPTVSEHFKSGSDIKAANNATDNSSSCIVCHNLDEMKVDYIEDDTYSTSLSIPSHYGKSRATDPQVRQGDRTNCTYCHQNTSTAFAAAMVNTGNSNISNHSTRYSSSPYCTECHNSGWIHNSTLTKPVLRLPESTFCLGCHSYMGMVTGVREKHNNSVNCSECHLKTSNDIHPVKYLRPDANYTTDNSTAVDCTSCHQNPGFFEKITGKLPPQIPEPLNHSNDPLAGQKWNSYWTQENPLSACNYCHGDTKHSKSALGRPSHFKGGNIVNSTISEGSTWCQPCHYQGASSYSDMVITFLNDNKTVPPEITGNFTYGSLTNSTDGRQTYFNHSGFDSYTDAKCKECHGSSVTGDSVKEFIHSVATGAAGGPDCATCHDTGGMAPKTIDFSVFKQSVHTNLNSNAANSTPLSEMVDKACWACHDSNGSQPQSGSMGDRLSNPRKCDDNECHALSQSFKAPMVYSHFKDADLNSNPSKVMSFNISTKVSCVVCHSNSLNAESENLNASVSHYGSRKNLIDSMNCIYCHLDRDNARKWGNAVEINKNRSDLIEMDRENNKFTARSGEFVDLGQGYRIRVKEVSALRGSAAIELYKVDKLIDSQLVNAGRYEYSENLIINNASARTPVIILNVTGMFLGDNESLIQFEGFMIKRLHSENRTNSCYECHFRSEAQKRKYEVIERRDDYVYYTEVLFNSSDRKEYEQEQALRIIANATPEDKFVSLERARRKGMAEKEKWNLAEGYSLTLEEVSENSDSARFLFEAGNGSFTDIVRTGEVMDFETSTSYPGYTYRNITIFRAKVSEISQPGIVVLEDILALSPEIKRIKDNESISGYNASWLWENNTIITGRIPSNFHSPRLYDGRDGGSDCTTCHTIDLGVHAGINRAAKSNVNAPYLNTGEPCWACHGNGEKPEWHPATYRTPRNCKSCHVEQKVPFFNAAYVGDEKHGEQEDCTPCHVTNKHKITKFDVTPGIRNLSLSKKEVYAGEKIVINVRAAAGHMMRLRAAEYFVDSPDKAYPLHPLDGSFDGQIEELNAELNTTGLAPGEHLIYVKAMERNNKWGEPVSTPLVIKNKEPVAEEELPASVKLMVMKVSAVSGVFALAGVVLALYIARRKLRPGK